MKDLTKQRVIFWLALIVLCVLAFFTFSNSFECCKLSKTVSINLQQFLVLITIGGLVGTLFYSKKYAIKLRNEQDREVRLKKYNFMIYLRLAIFIFLCVLCLFMYVFTLNSGSHLIFGMIMIMFIFIWPSKNRAIYETEKNVEGKSETENDLNLDENKNKV